MRAPIESLLALLAVTLAPPARSAGAEVSTVANLREEGVTIRRIELQALTASVEIDVAVDEDRAPGSFVAAECVVLKEPVAAPQLAAADAAVLGGGAVARRARSAKPKTEFLVLGREIPRAYLAIEFAVARETGGRVTRRYLLSVSLIGDGPPAEAAPGPK